DQLGIVEIVAGIHKHALPQAPAHCDFLVLIEQQDSHAVDFGGMLVDDLDRGGHGGIGVGRAPVTGKCRVEHVAEPMDDYRLAHPTPGSSPEFSAATTRDCQTT